MGPSKRSKLDKCVILHPKKRSPRCQNKRSRHLRCEHLTYSMVHSSMEKIRSYAKNICCFCDGRILRIARTYTQTESESEFTTGGFTANQFVLEPSPLRLTTSVFFSAEHLRFESLRNISDERMTHSLVIALGPRQRSHSRVRVQWES
jgi:hypothetical protein